jgi:EipB-like
MQPMKSNRKKTLFIAALAAVIVAGFGAGYQSAAAPADAAFFAYKALYDVHMVAVQSGAGVSSIRGQMYYEQDDACDAWNTDQRFTMEYQYPERSPVNSTSHYVAWEAKDGSSFSFNSERQENGRQTEVLRGSLERKPDGTAIAAYTRPQGKNYDLPRAFLLPNGHTQEILRMARAGEKFSSAVLFDGTDADGPVSISTLIGAKLSEKEIRALPPSMSAALPSEAWHVRLAVFPLKSEDVITPAYEMDIVMHGNGVISSAIVDYHTFKLSQVLKTLEKLPPKACP